MQVTTGDMEELYGNLKGVSAPASVHGKKKSAASPMDQLFRKAAGRQQELPVHTLD